MKATIKNQGNAWGGTNGIYTDDSNIGKAAVHAGLSKLEKKGFESYYFAGTIKLSMKYSKWNYN